MSKINSMEPRGNPLKFAEWLADEIDKRQVDKRYIANAAIGLDFKGFPPKVEITTTAEVTIGRIVNKKRHATAEHVIRIARALNYEFLQLLCIAGYVLPGEVSLSKTFVPDDPRLYRIWQALKEMDGEELAYAEEVVTGIRRAGSRRDNLRIVGKKDEPKGTEPGL